MAAVAAESAREWETLKYDSFFIPSTILNDTDAPIPREALSSCAETGLTAFAQLVALRLNTKRALISLFDSQYQYIVAEATQSVPLRANTKYVDQDLWLCGTAVPRQYGICECVLIGPTRDTAAPLDEDAHISHRNTSRVEVSVVSDLSADTRFCERPFVKSSPHHRFYAGVPIRSPKGFNIGVLCAFDDQPRATLDNTSQDFLIDVSESIMMYLESRRASDKYRRSERMVLGLGNFIQGKDQPADWWPAQKPHINRPNLHQGPAPVDVTLGGLEPLENTDGGDTEEDVSRPGLNPTAPDEQESPTKGLSSESIDTTDTNNTTSTAIGPVDPHKIEVDRIFNKAANIIRQSLDVDGALFLDASVGSWGGLVNPSSKTGLDDTDVSTSSSSDDNSSRYSVRSSEDDPCKFYAVSTDDDPVFLTHNPTDQATLTEKFLKKLIRRYPNGKIFSYNTTGNWYSGESSGEEVDSPPEDSVETGKHLPPRASKSHVSPYSRRNEAKTIGALFPGARSVALVPLWDPYRDRWYAGGFIWSKSVGRILTTDADLPYLRAFGMITMSEITRLDVAIADKAKTDILGSLSHELRSPLHGVVAAAELMHDTNLDPFQVDVVHTIEISGKTLLDTIDHLLAYSKINTFLRASKSQRKNNKMHRGARISDGHTQQQDHASIETGMMTLTSDVALDVLAEEVIESVFIGHSFQHMVAAQLVRHGAQGDMTPAQERLDTIYSADMTQTHTTPHKLPTTLGDVQLIIDIEPQVSWTFHTQPGAVRRIIMNLFGNSLKYTSKGHIKISLRQEASAQRSHRSSSNANVILTVSDTGKGISQDFLRNRLFTPFSQEDQLAPGTGLGLSLVRQIVTSLGGSVIVRSDIGRGTAVTVSLPLAHSQKKFEDRPARFDFDTTLVSQCRASAIGFRSSARSPSIFNQAANPLIESLPLNWFGMQLCEDFGDHGIAPDADLVIYSEAAFGRLSEQAMKNHKLPVLVVCHNAANAMKFDNMLRQNDSTHVFEFVHQPNTPRKFGKTVAAALTRWKEMKRPAEGNISSSSDTTLDSASATSNENETPPSSHRSSAQPSQDPDRISPGRMTPFGKRSADTICRLWNMDVDPGFTLSLPRRRRSSRSPPTDASSSHGSNGPSEVEGGLRRIGEGDPSKEATGPVTDGTSRPHASTEGEVIKDGSHFLIVDDNPINLKILSTYMKRFKRPHSTAVNGLEALEKFRLNPARFCCILMDINMPVMDGLESTRQMRHFERHHKLEPVTIIAITGLGSQSAREEAFASGLDLFLTRPVRMNELHDILKERGLNLDPTKQEIRKDDGVQGSQEAASLVEAAPGLATKALVPGRSVAEAGTAPAPLTPANGTTTMTNETT
ncbi:histidine kinase G7 [Plectosphaerella plurivora]|uniref:Histidine kinase G7 n=1 Tax=Plectosphaerella plurivora TaxID=936078 RepID=A0A9P8VCK5_9PEZI|nr:histidine kinase G7 [Plectosphaerella plurivora]